MLSFLLTAVLALEAMAMAIFNIIMVLLAVVGLCSAYCLPGIRRVRDRQTDENIKAAEDIWDCF